MEYRTTFCYTEYMNKTNAEWLMGAQEQYQNHSDQMAEKSARIDPGKLNRSDTILITGNTACDISSLNGAHISVSDPIQKVHRYPNGTLKNTTYWNASDYDQNWDNFSELEQLLTDRCLSDIFCEGWTWIDAVKPNHVTTNNPENPSAASTATPTTDSTLNSTFHPTLDPTLNSTLHPTANPTTSPTRSPSMSPFPAHYYLLSSLADPINSNQSGVCYIVSRYTPFGSINSLQNRTDMLRDEYMTDYQHQIGSLSDSLNGMWSAIQSLGDNSDDNGATYTVIVDNDPHSAEGYNIDIQLHEMVYRDDKFTSSWYVIVNCPGCPDGNFSSPYLQVN